MDESILFWAVVVFIGTTLSPRSFSGSLPAKALLDELNERAPWSTGEVSDTGQTQPFGRHVVASAVDPKADKPRIGPEVSEVPN